MQKILLAPLPALVLLLLLTAVLSAAFAIVKILLLAFLLPGHFHANFLLGILAQNRPQSRQVLLQQGPGTAVLRIHGNMQRSFWSQVIST